MKRAVLWAVVAPNGRLVRSLYHFAAIFPARGAAADAIALREGRFPKGSRIVKVEVIPLRAKKAKQPGAAGEGIDDLASP